MYKMHKDFIETIKNVIHERGIDIVKNKVFISILSDLHAFPENVYKNILRTAIEDKLYCQFLEIGVWNDKSKHIIFSFANQYAMNQAIVKNLFLCIASGLGWNIPELEFGQLSTNTSRTTLKINVYPKSTKIYVDGEYIGKGTQVINNIEDEFVVIQLETIDGDKYIKSIKLEFDKENLFSYSFDCSDTLFFTDMNQVKVGDLYYSDGSFTHKVAKGKEVIGVVFSLNPSPEDIARGWTHGYIISTKDVDENIWGNPDIEIPNEKYMTIENIHTELLRHKVVKSGYDSCNNPIFKKEKLFPIMKSLKEFKEVTPPGTSDWYIPSVQQIVEFCKNIYKFNKSMMMVCKDEIWLDGQPEWYKNQYCGILKCKKYYWTSTQYNQKKAYLWLFDYRNEIRICIHDKAEYPRSSRLVLSF